MRPLKGRKLNNEECDVFKMNGLFCALHAMSCIIQWN